MIYQIVPVIFALIGVCISVYTDLKERIVPNELTYSMVIIGISFSLIYGVWIGDYFRAFYGIFGAALAFALGYLMYLTGGWAGGDVKLFSGLGALLPAYSDAFGLSYDLILPNFVIDYPLFPLTVLINSVIAVAPVILVYLLVSKALGKNALSEKVDFEELEEGMIPAEIVYEVDGEIGRYEAGYIGFLRKLTGSVPENDRMITNPNRAAGVTEEQVEELQELAEKGELEGRFKVKKGMPFAPSLAVGTFISVFFGSVYWTLVSLIA